MSNEFDYEYHKKRADEGDPNAMHWLGKIFQKGMEGKQVDLAEAIFWYKKSAALGYTHALSELGALYYEGNGVRQDYCEAFNLFKRSADRPLSATYLGIMYHKGQGVEQDYEKAEEFLTTRAAQCNGYAQRYLELMRKEDRSIDTKVCPMCAESIKKAAIVCRYCNHKFRRAEF